MKSVSTTMSHEKARPTKVLTLSMNSSSFCISPTPEKQTPPGDYAGWCLCRPVGALRSGLLRSRLRAFAEVMVVRHLAAHVGIEVPAHDALREALLRREDLVEQRVVLALVDRRIVRFELAAQDGFGRLVEAHVVLGLQLDVVLGIPVDRLPHQVLRGRVHRVLDDRAYLGGQRVELALVEHDLELLGVL